LRNAHFYILHVIFFGFTFIFGRRGESLSPATGGR